MPLFQKDSKCKTFHIKMSSACSFISSRSIYNLAENYKNEVIPVQIDI